jgi:MFS family permease
MILWGPLSDKFQVRRTLVILGEIFAGFSTLIVFFGHRFVGDLIIAGWVIILGLSGVEFFWSMSNTGWSALISDLYDYNLRQKIQGQLASLGGVGRIIGILVGGSLYDGFKMHYEGWGFYEGPLFFIAAAVMLISTIPMFFTPEGGIIPEVRLNNGGINHEGAEKSDRKGSVKIFIVFLTAMIFINFGRNSVAITFSQYMVLDTGFDVSSELLSYLINSQSLGIIIFGLIAGKLGSKIGSGNSTSIGSGLAIFSLIIFSFSTSLPLLFIANFFRGVGDVIVTASAYAYASDLIPPENRARGFSFFNATFFLSWGLAGTFIAGPIIDTQILLGVAEVLAYRLAFFAAVILTSVGLLIFLLLVRKTREEVQ